jgi:hypothetical protein
MDQLAVTMADKLNVNIEKKLETTMETRLVAQNKQLAEKISSFTTTGTQTAF